MKVPSARPTWDDCREHYFDVDGSLRDLYILDTTRADWQTFIDFVRALPQPVTYTVDSQPQPLPEDVAEAFALREEPSRLLTIDLHGMILNAHFFIEDEIELDLGPREVAGESQFAALLDIMHGLTRAIRKPIRLTPENGSHLPLIEVFPDGHVTWWRPDSEVQP